MSGVESAETLVARGLSKVYRTGDVEVHALRDVDFALYERELAVLLGPSGSGKSTLLNILGGLDTPSAGGVSVSGFDLLNLNGSQRTFYRRRTIGFVWQQTARNLLPYLTALENVEMPMSLDGGKRRYRRHRAMELLDMVGLADRRDHKPAQLSGGEQQRVAIATAISNSPRVLFADEPTGELDTTTSSEIFEVLRDVNTHSGVTIVVVTHDPLVAEHVNRTVAIRDGRTSSEVLRRTEIDSEGGQRTIAEEFAVLDRVGRLQLPHEYVEALDLERRVRLTLDPDHINVWPDGSETGDDET